MYTYRKKAKQNIFLISRNPYIKHFDYFLLFVPVIIYYLVFHYAPMYGIIIAFKNYNPVLGVLNSPWVGFQNFIDLFHSITFKEVFMNTIIISSLRIIFGFPAPIILAILINEISNKSYKKLVQTVSYLPHFLSWVVLASIFTQFLSPSTGFINQIIKAFGLKPIFFLADINWFRPTLIITGIWQQVGWSSVIYLAAITSINPELYEASIVDGASRMQQITYITIPSIIPVITITLILNTGNIINAGFDQIFNLYNPAVYRVADILDTYVYRVGLINMNYSFGSAVGLFKNLISFAMIFIANSIAKKINEYGIW
jgi:putative aldouronate transport system permease protein